MRDWRIKDLKDFLEVSNAIDSPFKFFEVFEDEDKIRATVWMRTALISYEGKKEQLNIEELKKAGFKEAKELETKRLIIEDLL
jgi:hypothetical protein